jgi:hypothetical protein
MVADFMSADYGWLESPDGKEEAHILFKVGKNRKEYFTANEQAEMAIDILKQHCPDEDHILVYDNATTHLKYADGALSAQRMPKSTSKPESNWLVEVTVRGENGKPVYEPDGKVLKTKIWMEDATFADGTKQSLYFELDHPKAGLFKGMQVILKEWGLIKESKLKEQCKSKFQCPNKGQINCCCHQVLYKQLDFVQVESLLKTYCKSCGVMVIFLPKFHCELNFIEQCWGYAKQIYWHYLPSSKEADLEHNVLSALELSLSTAWESQSPI